MTAMAEPNRARLFAALVAAGQPLKLSDLGRLLGASPEGVRRAIDDLRSVIREAGLGVVVEEVAGGFRLVVDEGLVPALAEVLGPAPAPALSSAAVETLALVAYRQPITRGELEAARGASCVSTLETLQERELIKIVGRREVVGRPSLYGTTERFLIEFGLRSLDDLPPIDADGVEGGAFLRG